MVRPNSKCSEKLTKSAAALLACWINSMPKHVRLSYSTDISFGGSHESVGTAFRSHPGWLQFAILASTIELAPPRGIEPRFED